MYGRWRQRRRRRRKRRRPRRTVRRRRGRGTKRGRRRRGRRSSTQRSSIGGQTTAWPGCDVKRRRAERRRRRPAGCCCAVWTRKRTTSRRCGRRWRRRGPGCSRLRSSVRSRFSSRCRKPSSQPFHSRWCAKLFLKLFLETVSGNRSPRRGFGVLVRRVPVPWARSGARPGQGQEGESYFLVFALDYWRSHRSFCPITAH